MQEHTNLQDCRLLRLVWLTIGNSGFLVFHLYIDATLYVNNTCTLVGIIKHKDG